jgi:hypothetical protein
MLQVAVIFSCPVLLHVTSYKIAAPKNQFYHRNQSQTLSHILGAIKIATPQINQTICLLIVLLPTSAIKYDDDDAVVAMTLSMVMTGIDSATTMLTREIHFYREQLFSTYKG